LTLKGNPGFGKDVSYKTIKWPKNFFKNHYISIGFTDPAREKLPSWYKAKELPPTDRRAIKIIASSDKGLLTLDKTVTFTNDLISRCILWSWGGGTAPNCILPNCMTRITVQGLQPGKYYLPTVSCIWDSKENTKLGFAPLGDINGDNRLPFRHRLDYGGDGADAVPVRSSQGGYLNVYARTDSQTRYGKHPTLHGLTFLRPEAIELINIGPHAISLRGWTLMFNTGSVANNIGVINSAQGYNLRGAKLDYNPSINSKDYFYLVNNLKLFNSEFGSGTPNNKWGGAATQSVPVWEIPSESWGVQYEIVKAVKDAKSNVQGNERMPRIYLKNANFKVDQFKGEVLEMVDSQHRSGTDQRFDGTRWRVVYNGKDWFAIATGSDWPDHLKRLQPPNCDRVMLIGMPAKGGIVSMTLKNEYQQIAARTIAYDYLDKVPEEWYGYSAEKIDPTGYNWAIREKPTISGQTRLAENRAMRSQGRVQPHVKNGPFVSIGEIRKVSTGGDFENVSEGQGAGAAKRAIAAMANVFCSSPVRLEAADETADMQGWDSAMGTVAFAGHGTVTAVHSNWEKDQWAGHTLRFMTGRMRGESFPIFGNTKKSLLLKSPQSSDKPRSTPGKKSMSASKDDTFSIGPGYRSPLCYTRKNNRKGEWTWHKRIAVPGEYDLYIFGLNDAISTTEFLEENLNASLDVEVWNYSKNVFDTLCQRKMYNKSDEIHAGKITREHVSENGDFKMRITSHQVVDTASVDSEDLIGKTENRRRTGFAWFNYAVITPVPVIGRVNVNTAPARLLASLPGVDMALAKNIASGCTSENKPGIKPYKYPGDLLDVQGMTLKIFHRIANLITVSSSAYTLDTECQAILDVDGNGRFDEESGDKILGEKHVRFVLQGQKNTDEKMTYITVEQNKL